MTYRIKKKNRKIEYEAFIEQAEATLDENIVKILTEWADYDGCEYHPEFRLYYDLNDETFITEELNAPELYGSIPEAWHLIFSMPYETDVCASFKDYPYDHYDDYKEEHPEYNLPDNLDDFMRADHEDYPVSFEEDYDPWAREKVLEWWIDERGWEDVVDLENIKRSFMDTVDDSYSDIFDD